MAGNCYCISLVCFQVSSPSIVTVSLQSASKLVSFWSLALDAVDLGKQGEVVPSLSREKYREGERGGERRREEEEIPLLVLRSEYWEYSRAVLFVSQTKS